jgi:hypothetical protein
MNSGDRPKPSRPGHFIRAWGRRYRDPTVEVDALADEFDANPAAGWVYGVLAAGLIAAYGISCFLNGYGYCLRGRGGFVRRYDGEAAYWLGGIYVGLGLMLHFHSFWGTQTRLSRYHELGFYAALVGTAVATARFVWLGLR